MNSWLKATAIRVIRTGAQAALAAIGAAVAFSEVAWDEVAGVTGLAMVISFLMALAGLPETPEPGPLEGPVEHMRGGDEGQAQNLALVLVFLIGFLLGALCYANGIIVGD